MLTVRNGNILRYPGGKGRMLNFLRLRLAYQVRMSHRLVEPFVGGGSFFFTLAPRRALLADINSELIDLYRGIRLRPERVWQNFKGFPRTKLAYYSIRSRDAADLGPSMRAARTLYLNRTCFKGMWRHNLDGRFNVGYGGQERRWVVRRRSVLDAARLLRRARLKCADFEEIIDQCTEGDFLFLDPPYRPGERDMIHDHYACGKFTYADHKRLAAALARASKRRIRWAMTTSSSPSITALFRPFHVVEIPRGTGRQIGSVVQASGEVLIRNYMEKHQ